MFYKINFYLTVLLLFVVLGLVVQPSYAFIGPLPGQSPGTGGGVLVVDSDGALKIATSTIYSEEPELRFETRGGVQHIIFNPSGNVGVGPSSPAEKLDVAGNVKATSFIGSYAGAVSAANVTSEVFGSLQGNGNFAFPASLGVATSSESGLPQPLSVYGNGYFEGSVGIGTTVPSANLDVFGTNARIYLRDSTAVFSPIVASGINYIQFGASVSPDSRADLRFTSVFADTTFLTIQGSSGNVGIGTTAPAEQLHATGRVRGDGGLCIGTDCRTAWPSAGGYVTIQEEGTSLTQRGTLNFIGPAITAADDVTAGRTNVTLAVSPSSANVVGTGRIITAGAGLTGGGDLSANRTLSIATGGVTFAMWSQNGCASGQIPKWNGTAWACAADDSGGGSGDITDVFEGAGINVANPGGPQPTVSLDLGSANSWTAQQTFNGGAAFPNSGIWNTSGNVGIGTTAPAYNLEVERTGDAAVFLEADTDNSGEADNAFVKFSQDGALVQAIVGHVGNPGFDPENNAYSGTLANTFLIGTLDSNGTLHFGTNDAVRMTITTAGNVGIGTTAPSTLLEALSASDSILRLTRSGATNPTTFRLGIDSALVVENSGVDSLTLSGGNVSWPGTLTGGSVPWARLTSFPAGCASGEAVRIIGTTLTCVSVGSGTVTSVGSGAGLTGGPITTSGTLSVNTTAISTCTGSNQKIIWDGTNARFTCGTDLDSGGDITGVTAGSGLTGGGTSGTVTLNVGAGTGISVAADSLSINTGAALTWTALQTFAAAGTDIVADKIDVGTVDPVYTIGGKRYATYLPAMTGVKEETTGVVRCQELDVRCQAVIDFGNLNEGSDLWLFYQTTDLGENWENLTVLLTPGFAGDVWYKKLPKENKIMVYGTGEGEVSYRLTASRFDWKNWSNYSDAEHEGFNLDKL